jgi:hypothetical protein
MGGHIMVTAQNQLFVMGDIQKVWGGNEGFGGWKLRHIIYSSYCKIYLPNLV